MIVSIALTSQGGESVEATEPTPTPLPIPTPIAGIVTFSMADAEIMVGDVAFTLLDCVSAQTSGGEIVLVWVVDDGGFSADIPGEYRVTYGAMQEGELVTATRMVSVIGESDEEVDALSQPTG
ncbi:MAG: hypothetical protein HGA90_07220, partial [Alphaproteobacteria bacterium]|nr:hypothetical protein [Alphaproteobacteria bacterium]